MKEHIILVRLFTYFNRTIMIMERTWMRIESWLKSLGTVLKLFYDSFRRLWFSKVGAFFQLWYLQDAYSVSAICLLWLFISSNQLLLFWFFEYIFYSSFRDGFCYAYSNSNSPKSIQLQTRIMIYIIIKINIMDNKQKKCWTPGCGKPAKMQCPVCQQMDLEPSFFCSQQCFKATWPVHKLCHISREEQQAKKNSKFKFTGPLRPGVISKKRPIPQDIPKPDYYYTSIPKKEQETKFQKEIEVKDKKDIETMRQVGILARKTLDLGHSLVKPGITTDQIDVKVHDFIIENKAYPSPYNYYQFPKSLCTSVNEVICHGIPDSRPLQAGDIVNLDVTVYKHGFHIDLNETYFVGQVSQSSKFLVTKSYECLQKALDICKPGTMYRDVGNVITKYIEENGLAVNQTYCGHGIGKEFHIAPNVPHYANNKAPGFMKPGHVFTIEPMINAGVHKDITWPDNWTAVTADGQRSAQFEHTILITETGYQLFTARLEDSPKLEFML